MKNVQSDFKIGFRKGNFQNVVLLNMCLLYPSYYVTIWFLDWNIYLSHERTGEG